MTTTAPHGNPKLVAELFAELVAELVDELVDELVAELDDELVERRPAMTTTEPHIWRVDGWHIWLARLLPELPELPEQQEYFDGVAAASHYAFVNQQKF